ncbi:MAG: hypothetical protein FD174_2351 [Geobacteraceae bacterium]|nr:MAG: hypothetical protein FD174_2351 [Geobacteraceae bacterium]
MKTTVKKRVMQTFLVLAMAMPASHASAADSAECKGCGAATDQELAAMRGGYVAGDGLEITFGIERAVFVNGMLQAVNTLNIPKLGSGPGQALPDQLLDNMLIVRQNGAGNSISPALNSQQSGLFTLIQNSLDHAVIKNVTQINASVNVLNTFRDMNMRSLMNQQLVNAVK